MGIRAVTGRGRASVAHQIPIKIKTAAVIWPLWDKSSGLKKIKICVGYKYKGSIIKHLPFSLSDSSLEPIYEELDGWEEDIFEITNYETLPTNFKNYIDYLETKLNLKIKIVSVGPDRKQTIFR